MNVGASQEKVPYVEFFIVKYAVLHFCRTLPSISRITPDVPSCGHNVTVRLSDVTIFL